MTACTPFCCFLCYNLANFFALFKALLLIKLGNFNERISQRYYSRKY
ncbi:hypothetical protein MHA_1425 [Mannheimia haemolytica PHL213]|nr:hypothetical protein MHA_1425 [Mannheimia haemolytica PHL213]